ncbi:BON domain-containing protein [Variovorax ginsengisoli]|uniref:BON domain-containing protein n=1 Tax=Variovorax ginsengisoli TaxID=363844 RepID=A0ABT8S642_9BURK|nr:BON domain-containing protein [Variovorax ginsengisoli]MDN8615219.1 BON domain-containing protein [Variovorax ginsengisoli]MDO1534389.1 BON domain-containing protein [Variovorax ginsengisoli]
MRSDAELRSDVQAELDWEPAIKSTGIGVAASDGVVTLTGHVASHAEKYAAERAAQRVNGVKALAVEITVKLPDSDQRTDTDIALAVERGLAWSALVPADKVKAMVENGWVTLTGEVEWDYQRKAAEKAVRNLMGVTGVSNLIVFTPKVVPSDVEKRLRDALERQADREAEQIDITVTGSQIKLRGTVHSWAEFNAVQHAAWSAPGVTSVMNDLVVQD